MFNTSIRKEKQHDKSTGLRADDPNDTAKAKRLRAELEANEHGHIPLVNGAAWDSWVPKFLDRHCQTDATFERYEDAWKWLALWLQRERIQWIIQIHLSVARPRVLTHPTNQSNQSRITAGHRDRSPSSQSPVRQELAALAGR